MGNNVARIFWSSASRSDVGMVRKLNEDACLELAGHGVWAVADGMGGHSAGDVASQAVVDALADISGHDSLGGLIDTIQQRLETVNRDLNEEARRRHVQVIGSTVVVMITRGEHGVALWAGDSRAYRYRNGELSQLTLDHSQVEELVVQGVLTREQAEDHPASNMITRAVGVTDVLQLDSEMFDIAEGDTYLLCSDGLYNEVSRPEIRECLATGTCQQICDLLVERALAHGARDNVTVVVIRALDEEQTTRTRLNPSPPDLQSGSPGSDDDPTRLD